MTTGIGGFLATVCAPIPEYSHTEIEVGTVILLVTIAVITVATLVLLLGRRGR